MRIKFTQKPITRYNLNSPSFLENRIGFWATVTEVNSCINACNIVADTGYEFRNVPVCSNEWVKNHTDYVSGERNLPPVNSRVFVLTPTHTITGAFILCSGIPFGEESLQTLFSSDTDKDKNNNIHEVVTQSGWNNKEYYDTGNKTYISQDENIEIDICPKEDSENSLSQEIKIKAWNTDITISKSDGVTISTDGPIGIETSSTNTLKVGNTVSDLGSLISNLIDGISNIVTIGSPGSHKLDASSTATLTELKTKWEQVFKG